MSDIARVEEERAAPAPLVKIDLEQILRHLRERERDKLAVEEKEETDRLARTVTPDYYYG